MFTWCVKTTKQNMWGRLYIPYTYSTGLRASFFEPGRPEPNKRWMKQKWREEAVQMLCPSAPLFRAHRAKGWTVLLFSLSLYIYHSNCTKLGFESTPARANRGIAGRGESAPRIRRSMRFSPSPVQVALKIYSHTFNINIFALFLYSAQACKPCSAQYLCWQPSEQWFGGECWRFE